MSFGLTEFPWNSPITVPTSGVFTFDINIDKNYPALELTGTEPNSVYTELREVSGDSWLVKNATFNGSKWVPVNSADPAYALRLTAGGTIEYLSSPVGANPASWSVVWSVTNAGVPTWSGAVTQYGTSTSVSADGSNAFTLTFPTAFPNSCYYFGPAIINPFTTNGWALSLSIDSISKTSVVFSVYGAPSGGTCSVNWTAVGN